MFDNKTIFCDFNVIDFLVFNCTGLISQIKYKAVYTIRYIFLHLDLERSDQPLLSSK